MEIKKENSRTNLHLVMFPFFAFGHISPFVQLSNKLSSHGVKISFFSAQANINRIQTILNPNPTTQVVPLTIPHVEGLPQGFESTNELNPTQSELLKVALDLMQPQIKNLLLELKPHFVIFDFAQEWLPKMAYDLGIKTAFYSVFVALSTAFLTVPSRLHSEKSYPNVEQLKYPPSGFPKTSVTCMKTFEARDFLYMFKSFHNKPCVYDRVISGLQGCSIILAKTCNEMEGPYVEYVKSQFKKPVLLVGSVVPEVEPTDELEGKWGNWLDQFEAKSVIFCSFGSETFLNDDQIKELALGLELTNLPFFLVLNFPKDKDASTELKRALPEGFLERVKGKGVISSGWVQQQQILAHKSVGCYLCHGGFSSVIEGLVNDCQLVMLPLKGDQFLNCKLVSGDLRAGVEVNRRDEDGHFGKWDIKSAIKSVMVEVDEGIGKSIRVNHKKWRDFLLDKSVQDKLILDLVKEMEGVAGISS
ncbi:UDP-glucuronosyl and UDP-glucosyl transferase [Handroanthus impetiginosus]|uniref:Glycosyltransferase n=1 Tax=Handroanthus impetiginosus TaxID=429701 RepID=A0A2G9H958_9LAMI|nr:UDP-glucuronosyl and UDP-glucosyl transferase [Handroanthus impetiginosus]